jgi:hypothetical protein
MSNSPAMDDAIQKTFEKLKNMSKEEFDAELENHKDGDFGKILLEIGYFERFSYKKFISDKELLDISKEFENEHKGTTLRFAYASGICKGIKLVLNEYKRLSLS